MNKELDDMQKLINHLRNKPQELSENISGWKRTFKSDACLAADMIECLNAQLAAERAKVAQLSDVIDSQKQTHDALIKKAEGLEDRLQAAQVTKEATDDLTASYMAGFNSRDDEMRGLKAQNAVMREALERLARLGNGENYGNSDGNVIAQRALSLTPSDAADLMRKKDEERACLLVVMANALNLLPALADECGHGAVFDSGIEDRVVSLRNAIEAARAAGVDVGK